MSRSPVAVLLESYVLDAVGALSPERERLAIRMVESVFPGPNPSWRAVLESEFGLADGISEQLKQMWDRARSVAQTRDVTLSPEQFAAMVVEENFADAVEMVTAELITSDDD